VGLGPVITDGGTTVAVIFFCSEVEATTEPALVIVFVLVLAFIAPMFFS
jgi:hypothetical protein